MDDMTTTEVRTTQDLDFTQDSYAKECLQVEERPRRVLRDTIPSGPHELASLLAKDEVDRCNSDSSRKNFMRKTYKSKYSPPASPTASLHSTLTNRVSSDNEQVSPRTLSAPSPISLDPVLKSTSVVLPRSIGKVTKQAPSIDSPFKHPIHTTNTTRRTCAEIQSLHNSDQADKLTTPNLEAVTIRPPNLPLVKSATPTISSIDRKHYVSIDMPIPTEQMRIWEGGLASRLEDALRRSSRATHDSEAPLALEFYMVGTSTKDLRACIVITCCSSSRKKALKSFLGGLKWLRDSGLQHIILVDKTFGHRASKSLTNVAADSTFKINARLPSKISTLCGIEAETSKACPNGQSDEIARFTLGGVIFLDGRAYCLTVAHPFGASMHGSQSSSSSTIDRTESDSDDSEFDSPLDGTSHASSNDVKDSFNRRFYPDMVPNTSHIGAQQLKTPGKDEHRDPKHPLRPFPYKSMVNHNDVSFLRQATISKEPDKLDWALLLLEADYAVPNVFRIPGEDEDIEIGGYLSVENLTSGSVWVVAGSGVQQGTLNGNLASIYLWGHFHKVKQITLQRSLLKGDSGSWVIRDGRLCGYIIAGRDSLPWAYMIPIQSVFEDMRQTFGGSDIRLASKAYGRFIPQSNTSTTVDVKKERLSRPEDYSYPRFSSTVSELQSVLEGPSSFGDRGTAQAHTVSTGGRLSPVLESLIPTSDSTGNEVTGGLISWFIQKISDSWGFKGKGRSVPHHKDYQNLRRVSVELDQWSANAESEGIFSDHAHSEADIHKPLSGSKKFIAYRDHSDSCLKQNTFAGADFNKLAVTFTLCIAHMLTELEWQRRGALSEIGRRLYTMTTTVISIALVLNLTSAAKGVALKLRWPFLAGRYSNMIELDHILHADSFGALFKLALESKRLNIWLRAGVWYGAIIYSFIAIVGLSLNYDFEVDATSVLRIPGTVGVADLRKFYPSPTNSLIGQEEDEVAHQHGKMAPIYGWSNAERLPEPNMRVSLNYSDIIFYDYQAEHGTFVFWDSNSAKSLFVFTNRTINITHTCDAHRVTAGKDSISEEIQVDGVGQVYVSQKKPLSTTFFINNHTACPDGNPRCSVVEVLELSETQPWYYKCRITLDTTRNDPQNRSFVSDSMATIATSSIARGGLIDSTGQQAQLLPQSGFWGQPLGGDNATMGRTISMFSLASIAGAALYNPWNYYPGMTPIEGQVLKSRFLGINSMSLGFLFSVHLFFYVYAVLEAKKVQIGPTSPLEMNMMLRPVTVALSDMSYDSDNKALRNRMKHTMVRYERARNDGKWKINVIQDEEYHSLPQAWAGRPILSADSRLRMANDGSSAVSWVSRESF